MIHWIPRMPTGLGLLVQREIKGRGWSQRHAADQTGIPFTTLNNIINGRNEPDLATLRRLARGLGLTLGRIIQAMDESGEGASLPRPLRSLSAADLAYLDRMDEEEFKRFLDTWRQMRGDS